MRSFSVYERRPLALAPLHLSAAQARRRDWRLLREVPAIAATAHVAWLRSLRWGWRVG